MINTNNIKKEDISINDSFINKIKITYNNKLSNLQILILFFFIYSGIGWCLETIYCIYTLGHFEKRGFLYGPLCPIYGYGAIILLISLQPFKENKLKLFFSSLIIFSIFEYLVGYGLDALFSMKFWDYCNEFLNINGRITLSFSVIWGILGIIFMNYIHPFIEKISKVFYNKINFIFQHILLYALILLYIVDTFFSIIKYIN